MVVKGEILHGIEKKIYCFKFNFIEGNLSVIQNVYKMRRRKKSLHALTFFLQNLALVDADYSSEDSSLDSDTSTDDETEDHLMCGEVNENNIKMPKQGVKVTHGKQLICMVNETETKNTDSSSDSENHRPEAGT